jgi:3-dehydroquinate synthase
MLTLSENRIFFPENFHIFESSLLDNHFSYVFILVDQNTKKYCLPIFLSLFSEEFSFSIIEIDDGEHNKSIESLNFIWSQMEIADRKSVMINLGGGVLTDMGGLAASLFKRGIAFINVPTTLLAMIDASIGGKTGVNFGGFKNHIGSFSNAHSILIYPHFLDSLPLNHVRSGLAEILKIGLISNSMLYYDILKTHDNQSISSDLIKLSIIEKLKIVVQDPNESSIRKLLNFGHTIGHALESYSLAYSQNPILHGEAIYLGIIAESFISTKLNLLKSNDLDQLTNFVLSVYPKSEWPDFDFDLVMNLMKEDKKNSLSKINFSLPTEIGAGKIDFFPDNSLIVESLYFLNSL